MKEKQADRGMQDLRPTVWIGKQGCTGTIIQEIVSQLDKRNLVKVKVLQHAEVDPRELADRAGADLIDVRGRTFVIAKRQKK
jgi:RNA-binding protein